jgi:hypothetical protein
MKGVELGSTTALAGYPSKKLTYKKPSR